ncbi:hypothetical protein ABZ470_23635 [Streptosporangium sp. NPDC020072]|uniref:hypothetical protein n=1 Tax=Streptosporangium sp. NPDC020072 TaxID=3154788 RepID=UPI003439A2D6
MGLPTGGAAWALGAEVLGSSYVSAKIFWKVAGSSEPANYTFSQSTSGVGCQVHIVAIQGATATPSPVFATSSSYSTPNISTPGLTPPGSTGVEIRYAIGDFSSSTTGQTLTAPGGLTSRSSVQLGSYRVTGVATRNLASGSATTSLNFSAPATIDDGAGVTVAVASSVLPITGSGISSGEAWGATVVAVPTPQALSLSGIAGGEAFGLAQIGLGISLTGVPSAEAFGLSVVDAGLRPPGISSAESWGAAKVIIQQFISPPGIPDASAFGAAGIQTGYPITLLLTGIPSGEMGDGVDVRLRSQYVLQTPSIQETPLGVGSLMRRFGLHRGISIIRRPDGSYYSSRYPAQTELEEASMVYLGGRIHPISPEAAEELTDAGFGAYITLREIE